MEQLSLIDLMHATGGHLTVGASPGQVIDRISTDSRTLQPGSVFWALRGETHDGHAYISQAMERGAALCVANASHLPVPTGPTLLVKDTGTALMDLARWYRGTLDALVIGLTGSVGKTTTRDLIHVALAAEFEGIRSRKNFNNTIGLPLSLLEADHRHEFILLEMGASRIGDIAELVDVAAPEVGVVTAIGPAHLESFHNLQGIIQGKGELLEGLPPTGFAVLPGDDPILRQMADRAPCPVIFVGEGDDNHLQAKRVRATFEGLQFRVDGVEFSVPVCGRHHLSNALCAIAIAREIGIRLPTVAQGLERFEPIEGRTRLKKIGSWTVIDDTYNASPLSVAAACRMLPDLELPGLGRRILVLGDMRELGGTADLEHRRIGELAAQLKIDLVVACGNHAEHVAQGAEASGMDPHCIAAASDLETMKAVLDCWLEPGDVILVKGSRATRMERIVEWLGERAAIEAALRGTTESRRHCA
ncbi:MAG: UDP-N-acetylmuramoyl-tripeptide--D-alanyl-D-alanine ligase [Planctomycetes bacterium]|nr:UDP-N-acetylmuramoyl-tripeptide--D-alanyl-D-alanine ligase [Planctomycetota bacterium]